MAVSYKDNPELFEKVLRENLNSPVHTKESLINCAVQYALAAERYWFQLQDLEERYGKLRGELNMASQLLSGTKKTVTKELANVMESEFNAEYIANFLRNASDGVYKKNSEYAKKSRKQYETKEEILVFKQKWIDEYERKHGVLKNNGWKKEYINHYEAKFNEKISYRKLNKLIE